MLGLPLAGKTTWIEQNKERFEEYRWISADEYKKSHPKYNPDNVLEEVHEWSVNAAEQETYDVADKNEPLILDGGGINNRYTLRIVNWLRNNYGYKVTVVWIKTPYEVCLERNKKRERKVPETAITDKALKEISQFHKLRTMCDDAEVYDYFTNKYIFVDMDGVIAAQSTLPIVNGEIDFVNGEVHKWQKPVTPVIKLLRDLQKKGKELYILSATPNSFSSNEKMEWLVENFPISKERVFFVNQGKHKAEMLDNLRRRFKFHPKDVMLIDDMHDTLYKVKARGMNAMHPSEFLTHDWDIDMNN
jgi:predicted kinase